MVARWYVLRTEPKSEYQSVQALVKDGIETYCPSVKNSGYKNRHQAMPLFPGYLFIKWDHENQGWPTFRPAHKILSWLRFGDTTPSIPDQTICELTAKVDNLNASKELWQRYHIGDEVKINSGNFQEIATVIEESKSSLDKIWVKLYFMGRMIRVNVPWEDLESISESHPVITLGIGPNGPRRARRTRGKGRKVKY